METTIINHYDGILFNDTNEINETLKLTSQSIKFSEIKSTSDNTLLAEEKSIKAFFNDTYDINDNVSNKIKASELYDIVINSKLCNINKQNLSGLKNRLSQYLKDIGLKKKRYNDGYYYYGLSKKTQSNQWVAFNG